MMRAVVFLSFASVVLPWTTLAQTRTAATDYRGSGERHTVAEQYLYGSVNAERAAVGLPPLAWNRALNGAARFHAERMRSTLTLTHQLSGEPDLTARAAHFGAQFSKVAENVAVGQSILKMHDALMRSPHHRENILDAEVNSIAISVVASRGELWAVEDFAHDVEPLSFGEQEARVLRQLMQMGFSAESTEDARATCRLSTGYVGERPGFVMRYTTGDLERMPAQVQERLVTGRYSVAAVGACPPEGNDGFSDYNLAILLYR